MDYLVTKVPLWTLYYAGMLLLIFVCAVISMLREAIRGAREFSASRALIEEVPPPTANERVNGRSLSSVELLRQKSAKLPSRSASWWRPVDEAIERYESPDGQAGYFLLAPAHELLRPDELADRYYTVSRWQVIPSLLTSLGLL